MSKSVEKSVKGTLSAILLVLYVAKDASAYIDPGNGSYILQLGLAFVIGWLFSLKLCWKKIKMYFHRFTSKKKSDAKSHGR